MNRTLIIGIGNTLRGDDGVAQRVVAALSGDAIDADVECVVQLTVELAPTLKRYDVVLFIDASVLQPPGCWTLDELDASIGYIAGVSHHCGPAELIGLAALLYDASPCAYLLSIGAYQFDHRERISDELAAQIPEISARIRDWLLATNRELETIS